MGESSFGDKTRGVNTLTNSDITRYKLNNLPRTKNQRSKDRNLVDQRREEQRSAKQVGRLSRKINLKITKLQILQKTYDKMAGSLIEIPLRTVNVIGDRTMSRFRLILIWSALANFFKSSCIKRSISSRLAFHITRWSRCRVAVSLNGESAP